MTLLTKLILEFREKFKDSGVLESADKDMQLKYPELEVYLKNW